MTDTDIEAVAFFLADHAAVENAKVYINGGCWNRLSFGSYPSVLNVAIVTVIQVPWRALHRVVKFSVVLRDADATKVLGQVEGQFQVGSAPDAKTGDVSLVPITTMLTNLVVPRADDYSAVLEVDGTELARWPFRAVQVAEAGAPTSPGSADIPGIPPSA
jgi:hypothetical protein